MAKPGSYSQLYIQLVFATKRRSALLHQDIRLRVFSYISGILSEKKHKSIAVNGMSDHVHILLGVNPNISISDTVRDIKRGTTLFINSEHLIPHKFEWQDGYGAFSYSRSHLNNVFNYVLNQEEHHRKKTFGDEYLLFLEKFEIEYDERYLFDFFE